MPYILATKPNLAIGLVLSAGADQQSKQERAAQQ
jgi:hypothetical protein